MSDRITLLQEKVSSSQSHTFHRFSLAQAYYEQSDYNSAANHFQICVSEKPSWMMANLFLAKCELALGHIVSCRVHLEKTILLAKEQGHDDPEEEARKLLEQCELS